MMLLQYMLASCGISGVRGRQGGATMVEYALIVGLISIIAIVVLTGLGTNINTLFGKANTAVSNAAN